MTAGFSWRIGFRRTERFGAAELLSGDLPYALQPDVDTVQGLPTATYRQYEYHTNRTNPAHGRSQHPGWDPAYSYTVAYRLLSKGV